MGWNNQNVTSLLIINSSGGFTGLFVYSPSPGPGNLIASIAGAAGTDPYGNSYLAGIVSYAGGASQYSLLNSAQVQMKNAGSPAVGAIGMVGVGGFLGGMGFSGASNYNFDADLIGLIDAKNVAGTSSETWQTLTPVAGFAAGTPAPRYRREGYGITLPTVRLAGRVTLTANQVAGTNFFTLPAGYRPTNQADYLTQNNLSGAVGSTTTFAVFSSGALQIEQAGSTGNLFDLDGVTFPLD